ncbi:N-acetylneuraminate 9-O-acetyltransferase-like [Daphnia pulex]|uniref:N-acetylneuraminate 9-O-acetyltransferase-like n=1 Tax=Daphnia pulex TaxID=6669 RepID=UPI001EDD39D7|nr:N-acetylneuraminate 9-O-acetyltransferase-like [Daphnia pulex]
MPIIKFLCSFNRQGSNTRIKWNSQMVGKFIVLLALILLTIMTRNYIQKMLEPSPRPASTVLGNEAPLCTGNLLDKREHHYAKKADGSYDNSRLITKTGSCHLTRYTQAEAVGCLDALYDHLTEKSSNKPNLNLLNNSRKRLHIAFVGDSRIRQQFHNFLKLIPDYDLIFDPNPIPLAFHGDVEVISNLLRLRITFYWQPLIDDTVVELTRIWATDDETDPPYLLVLSMAVWHMIIQFEGADQHQLYQKRLKELAPILDQLANVSHIIWLNQYPTLEFYGNIGVLNTDIHSEKIHHYNLAIRRILGGHKKVRIWDSSNPLAEEYVRGCSLSQRVTLTQIANSFVHCKDFSHVGYIALSQSTQLLFNDICNDGKLIR